MKKLIVIILLFIGEFSIAQTYNPLNGTVSNKPYSPAQNVPTDGRSWLYDSTNFIWRPYQSAAEANAKVVLAKYRGGNYSVYINIGGFLNSNGTFTGGVIYEYWWRNGVNDSNLVRKYTDQVIVPNTVSYVRRLTDSTFLAVRIDSTRDTVLIRGTAAGGITSLTLNTPTSLFGNPVSFTNTGGSWSGSLVLNNQNANYFFAGPSIGGPGLPLWRQMVTADLPTGIPNANLQNSLINFSTGTAGVDINWSASSVSLGSTITLNIPNAGPSARGLLTSGFFTLFSNKVDSTSQSNDSVYDWHNGSKLFRYMRTGGGSGITQLTGDGTAGPGSGSQAFTLATVNSSVGTFGSASSVPVFTTNAKGLVTGVTNTAIQITESQVTNLTTDLAGKQAALSGTGYLNFSGTTPSYLTPTQVTANLNLFTSSLQGLVPLSGGGTANFLRADGLWAAPAGGGAVSSVSNSDGTLTISPTTGAVVASLALGHANTWSALQTFGTLTTTGTTIFSSLTSSGVNDSVVTVDPVTGQLHRRFGSFQFYAANGLSSSTVIADSFYLGGNPLIQNTTIPTAGFSFSITGLPSKATALGTDSVLIENLAGQLFKLPVPSGGGSAITSLNTDVVATGPGAATATIQPNVVTYAKIQVAAGQGLMGATGATNFGLVTLGTNLSMAGSVLNAGGTPTFQQTLTAGNVLTKQDTINQANKNLYFTGGGQPIFDSTKYKNVVTYLGPLSYSAFGDSYTVGSNATVFDSSYTAILSRFFNLLETNYGVSGSGAFKAIQSHNQNINPANSILVTVMAGFNDWRYAGRNTRTIRKIMNAHNAIFLNQFSKTQLSAGSGNAAITLYGSGWTIYNPASVGGKFGSNLGRYTANNGDSVVYTFTDSTWGVGLIGADSINNFYSTFDGYMDGVLMGHYTENDQTDSFTIVGQSNGRSPMALFGKVAFGTHKLKLINTGGTNIFAVDYFATLKDISNSTPLIVYEAAKMNATGYTITPNAASDAIMNAGNASLDSTIALWPSGYPVFIAKTNNYYTPGVATSSDSVHPNNLGHSEISQAGIASIGFPIGTDGTLFRLGNNIYWSINGKINQLNNQSQAAAGLNSYVQYNTGGILGADSGFVRSGQNIGIGKSTPTSLLHLSAPTPEIRIDDTTTSFKNSAFLSQNGDFAQLTVNIDPVSGVYSNTAKASSRVTLKGANGVGQLGFQTTNTNNVTPTQRMTIFGTGNIGIGTVNTTDDNSALLQLSNTSTYQLSLKNGSGLYQFFVTSSGNGSWVSGGGHTYLSSSIAPNPTTFTNGEAAFRWANTYSAAGDFSDSVSLTARDGISADSVAVLHQLSAGKFVIHKVAQSSLGGGVTTIGTFDGGTANSNGLFISGASLFSQSASATNPGMVNTGTQTFAGAKTFNSAPILTTSSTVGQVWTASNTTGLGAWASAANIYNTNGTLTGNRTLTLGTNNLFISGVNSGDGYIYLQAPVAYLYNGGLSDADYTIAQENVIILNPTITANRTLTFPNANLWTGRILYIDNQNTTSFNWNITATGGNPIKDASGNTVSKIPQGSSYTFLASSGGTWRLISIGSRNNTTLASNDLTGQTAAATVTSYAVPGSGGFNTFRVGGNLTVTAVSLDVIQLQVAYTDETNTARTQSFFVQGATTGVSATGANGYSPMDIRVKQGTTISVSTVLTTGTGSITYDVGANIIQLY